MGVYSWLHSNDLVEADGIAFGPGFIWPVQPATVTDGLLTGSVVAVSQASGTVRLSTIRLQGLAGAVSQTSGTPTPVVKAQGSVAAVAQASGTATVIVIQAQVSRIGYEALAQNPDAEARVSRIGYEALAQNPDAEARVSRIGYEVLVSRFLELGGSSTGETTINATLFSGAPGEMVGYPVLGGTSVSGELDRYISAAGRTTIVYATLDNGFNEMAAQVIGETQVSGSLAQARNTTPFEPVSYPLGVASNVLANLYVDLSHVDGQFTSTPRTEVYPSLEHTTGASSTGQTTVTGTLSVTELFSGSSYGETIVYDAELYVSGAGAEAELAGSSYGETVVYMIGNTTGWSSSNIVNAYYIYGNVTVGFGPNDTVADQVDHYFYDGNIITDFARFLYLYLDVGVGFDYTDDVSSRPGFVSQSYPDGDIVRDFARYLYQYVNIIPPADTPFHRLTIGPAPRQPEDLTPTPRPPRELPG